MHENSIQRRTWWWFASCVWCLQGEDVDQCPQCGKEFTGKNRRNNLVRHLKTHTGEKPFHCPVCPYRATRKEHMIRHLRKGSCVFPKFRDAGLSVGVTVDPYDENVRRAIEFYLEQFNTCPKKRTTSVETSPPPGPSIAQGSATPATPSGSAALSWDLLILGVQCLYLR